MKKMRVFVGGGVAGYSDRACYRVVDSCKGLTMNGTDFREIVTQLGYTTSGLAADLGVDADTITNRYKQDVIPLLWVHTALGLVAKSFLPLLCEAYLGLGHDVPAASNRKVLLEELLREQGMDCKSVAAALGVDVRTVRTRTANLEQSGVWQFALMGLFVRDEVRSIMIKSRRFRLP